MNKRFLKTVYIFAVLSFTKAATPSFLTKCKSDDSDCAKENAKKIVPLFAAGLPEYDVERLDPVLFKVIDSGIPNLIFLLTNVTLTGLKNCETKKIQRDVTSSKLYLKFLCATHLQGQYEIKGSVLFLKVNGSGNINVSLRKTVINVDMDIDEKEGDDGKMHWHIKSWQYSFDMKERPEIVFESQSERNKENDALNQAARELIASSSAELIREFGAPVFKTVLLRVVKNINHFFKAIPAEDLSID